MAVTVSNTSASLSGKTLLKAEDAQTITGAKTFNLGASAPFIVTAGAAKVANLDADKLDGQEGAYYQDASNLNAGIAPTARLTQEQVYASTGNQNDVAPTAGGFLQILCTGAAPVITGFSGGSAGRQLLLVCKGTTLKVTHQDAGSTAANRIICESTQGQIVGVNGLILLTYDATNSRWLAALICPGAAISYTPTWTGSGSNPAIGNGTLEGRFVQRGKICHVDIRLVCGGTTTFGSGTYGWALPLTASHKDRVRLSGEILDFGTAAWAHWTRGDSSMSSTTVQGSASTGSTGSSTAATVPMTWAESDAMFLGGDYEVQ